MTRALLQLALATSVLSTGLITVGCASKYQVQADDPATGSDAEIVVKKNKTGAYEVDLEFLHLAPPDRMDKKYQAYAVWFVTDDGAVKAGMLDYNEKKREGKLVATTPVRKFDLLVSLEDDLETTAPTGPLIVQQKVKGPK